MNKKMCDLFVQEKLLRPEQYDAVLQHMQRTGTRAEEAVLELGFAREPELLKVLAGHYRTNFVSSEKLSKADVPKATLDMIPRRFAETAGIFPVMFDPKTLTLSLVTADPDNAEALKEVQIASGAREVKAFVARPAAVKAAVAKAYGGDIHAFALLDRAAHAQFQAMLDVYERNLVTDDSMARALANESAMRERLVSESDFKRTTGSGAHAGAAPSEEVLAILNVLVSLLETSRQELRGHSAHVARLCTRVAQRMSLSPNVSRALEIAAYVHDLGKMGQFHLTGLNSGEFEGHRVAAQRAYTTPLRLLETVRLPLEATDAVRAMYERYDGEGFPDRLAGKEIPLLSRILAVCDTYSDLTQNPRNPYRKMLEPRDAMAVLAQHREKIFDPHIVDLFRHMVLGEDIRAKLLENRYTALIVDTDPEETTVIELRMIEQGFAVKTVRTSDQALITLSWGDVDLVVSELDLAPFDGLKLLGDARKQAWGKNLAWVVYTRRRERADAEKAFELGVLDFVAKPAPTDVFVAKLKAMLDQRLAGRARGVTGSLREMGLADMVQVLSQGRKSGNLRIRHRETTGEIHFVEGNVVNALWGELRGADAFYEMLSLTDGEFGLDPSFKPQARVIELTSEALLLEGMRRLDEK